MIQLNYRDPTPIYQQIKDGIRRLIATGVIQEGEKLPSVRALASQLVINPNTIQRAYNELEAEEIILSIPGKGSFAAEKTDRNALRKAELLQQLKALLHELRSLGVTSEELQGVLQGGVTVSYTHLDVYKRQLCGTQTKLQPIDLLVITLDKLGAVQRGAAEIISGLHPVECVRHKTV